MSRQFLFVRTDVYGGEMPLTDEREALASRSDVELIGVSCRTEDEVIAAARDADVLTTNESHITRKVLTALPKLRAVVRYGVGYDRVDLDAATELGIPVANVPDFCRPEIAHHAMLFVLAWNKRLIPMNFGAKAGDWDGMRKTMHRAPGSTYGQLLGIVGFGGIGRATAKMALNIGMEVASFSEHLTDEDIRMGVRYMPRDEMLRACDFLSIHCALNDETFHSIGKQEFAQMKPTAVVINTARGPVIDERALIDALQSGQIAGACLDVMEKEPPDGDNPLLSMDNVLITPHVSYYSPASGRKLSQSVIAEALRAITPGECPVNVVNREVLNKPNRVTG